MNVSDKDQMIEGLKDMAFILAEYRKRLLEQGFTELESLQLIISYQVSMFCKK